MSNSKATENYAEWSRISNTLGWKLYFEELNKIISSYEQDMENENLSADDLKRIQLIKKGLKMARDIPRQMEIKAKLR